MAKLRNVVRTKILKHASNIPAPKRLIVSKAKWFRDASSPVILMIDDLTNAWIEEKGAQKDGPDCDWGGKHFRPNSAITFLNKKLLRHFPHAKVTYFTVLGDMHSFNTKTRFAAAKPIDADSASVEFFRTIEYAKNSEITYHGLHHGYPQENSDDYVQEWESFQSVEEGLAKINTGKEIYHRVFGYAPRGGKYGGYKANQFSEKTIEKGEFIWWCREWMPRDTTGSIPDAQYELEYFGEQRRVVAVPTTLHGKKWTKRQVNLLLKKKQIIAIQEHISPRRPDKRTQTPNIYDDIKELQKLYAYMADKNVWYATCSDVARYFVGYANSIFYDIHRDFFRVEYTRILTDPIITLIITPSCLTDEKRKYIQIILPGEQTLSGKHIHSLEDGRYMVDIPVRSGQYSVIPAETPCPVLEGFIAEDGAVRFNYPDMTGEVELSPHPRFDSFVDLIIQGEPSQYALNAQPGLTFFCSNSSQPCKVRSLQGLFNP